MRCIKAFLDKAWEHKRLIVIIVALLVLDALLEDALAGEAMKIDTAAYSVVVLGMRRPWLTPFMEQFSSLASPVVLFVMCLMIAAFAPGRQPGRCAMLNLVLAIGLNVVLKNLVQRPRPDGFRLIAETGYSFPSGHSMVAMAFYGLVLWMVWKYEKDRVLRIALCILFAFTIAMVGLSRVYLGVHYASDVIAGFCVSFLWLLFYTKTIVPLFLDDKVPPKEEKTAA